MRRCVAFTRPSPSPPTSVHLQTFPGRHQGFHLKKTMLLNIPVPHTQAVCPMALSLTRFSMVRLQAGLNKKGERHGLSAMHRSDGSSFIE